jgi:hypothetical protein
LDAVRVLYRSCPACAPLGKALRAAHDAEAAGASNGDVVALLAGARGELAKLRREEPRLAPWLGVVAVLLAKW